MLSEEDRVTATGNTQKKFGEVHLRSFWVEQVDRQTNTQTDTEILITIVCKQTGAK